MTIRLLSWKNTKAFVISGKFQEITRFRRRLPNENEFSNEFRHFASPPPASAPPPEGAVFSQATAEIFAGNI